MTQERNSAFRTIILGILGIVLFLACAIGPAAWTVRNELNSPEAFADSAVDAFATPTMQARLVDAVLAKISVPFLSDETVQKTVRPIIENVVASDAAEGAWREAVIASHDELTRTLAAEEPQSGSVDLTVDFGPAARAAASATLGADALVTGYLEGIQVPITIVKIPDIAQARAAVDVIDIVGLVLPWVGLVAALGMILAARKRGRTVFIAGQLAAVGALLGWGLSRVAVAETATRFATDALPADAMREIGEVLMNPVQGIALVIVIAAEVIAIAGLVAHLLTRNRQGQH